MVSGSTGIGVYSGVVGGDGGGYGVLIGDSSGVLGGGVGVC